jgi:AraC-like DNA-binding protein
MPERDKDAFWISQNAELRLTATPVLYHCEPIWSWKAESLPDFAIWGILEGSGQLRRNGKPFSLAPGICFLFEPGESIEAEQDLADPLSLFVIRFQILDTNANELSSNDIQTASQPVHASSGRILEAIAHLALAWDAESEIEKQLQDHALRMLLLLIADASRTVFDDRIAKVSSLFDSGLSSSQFSRVFSKQYGEPPIQNLIHRRMKAAKQLVLETDLSIDEISHRVGYENHAFFQRQFLKHVGFDPESLRRNRAL